MESISARTKRIIRVSLYIIRHPIEVYQSCYLSRYNELFTYQFESVFVKGVWSWLYLKIKPGTTVIDIGAFIGDTALYFAMNPNVSKVLAFEVNPKTYSIARTLVDKSNFKEKITLKNEGVEKDNRTIQIDMADCKEGDAMFSVMGNDTKEHMQNKVYNINTVKLDDVLKGNKRIIIKSNCEGSEYNIFTKEVDLSNVYLIMLEYHYGIQDLERILTKKGFQVHTGRALEFETEDGKPRFLYAIKKNNDFLPRINSGVS